MKKFITFAAVAGCFTWIGFAQTTNAVAQTVAEIIAKPTQVKYVAQAKKWGTLRARFVVDGKVAEPSKVNAATDPFCAALPIMTENLIVGKEGALKNLAVYMDKRSKTKDIHPDLAKPDAVPLVLDNKNCVFVPHVLFVRAGQSINVTNSDKTGHNANFNFFNNEPVNFLVPPEGKKNLPVLKDEPAPIPVDCNIHNWMRAHVIVQDHPYVGISGEDGVLEIANLPVGQVTLRVWHELGTIDEANVGGKQEKWSKGRMEIDIKEGMNDLGTVKIAADKFTRK